MNIPDKEEEQHRYLPFSASGARRPNRSTNSSKAFLVGYPAQLILIASITPYNQMNNLNKQKLA
jgi:hypothetical protein